VMNVVDMEATSILALAMESVDVDMD
jgi:hypothetical protein